MTTDETLTSETLTQQCLRAARADVALCWGDYIDRVTQWQAAGTRDAGGGEDLRDTRAALVTALAIERAALGALVGDDDLDLDDDDLDIDDALDLDDDDE